MKTTLFKSLSMLLCICSILAACKINDTSDLKNSNKHEQKQFNQQLFQTSGIDDIAPNNFDVALAQEKGLANNGNFNEQFFFHTGII